QPESHGYIGERLDADAGLQYLNARYYDPKLAMFIQPDWWEVTKAGVGTNRYAYAGGDPVNGRDPGGNASSTSIRDVRTLNSSSNPFTGNHGGSQSSDRVLESGKISHGSSPGSGNADFYRVQNCICQIIKPHHAIILSNPTNWPLIGGALLRGSIDSPNITNITSGNPDLDAIFGGFRGSSEDKKGQSYPGTLDELNDRLEEFADSVPGSSKEKRQDGGIVIVLPDGTQVSTYPERKKSGTDKPGFQITKSGQSTRNGIKGTVEGGKVREREDDSEGE
ncbi:RHS repeat-associated core domain-containing protein, partial [Stagnihabitans tardus]